MLVFIQGSTFANILFEDNLHIREVGSEICFLCMGVPFYEMSIVCGVQFLKVNCLIYLYMKMRFYYLPNVVLNFVVHLSRRFNMKRKFSFIWMVDSFIEPTSWIELVKLGYEYLVELFSKLFFRQV